MPGALAGAGPSPPSYDGEWYAPAANPATIALTPAIAAQPTDRLHHRIASETWALRCPIVGMFAPAAANRVRCGQASREPYTTSPATTGSRYGSGGDRVRGTSINSPPAVGSRRAKEFVPGASCYEKMSGPARD